MRRIAIETSARFWVRRGSLSLPQARRLPLQSGTRRAQTSCVAALVFLGIGLLCAIIGRILLIGAAFGVSVWWGLGVFLPFGPLFFRLTYPELAHASRMFRLATVAAVLLYLICGPGLTPTAYYRHKIRRTLPPPSAKDPYGYAMEPSAQRTKTTGPQVQLSPTIAERQSANAAEFERLRVWAEKLRLQKRDLLHSDVEGNRAYNLELSQYNVALENANAEKAALAALTQKSH